MILDEFHACLSRAETASECLHLRPAEYDQAIGDYDDEDYEEVFEVEIGKDLMTAGLFFHNEGIW